MTDNENYVAETPSGGSRSPSGFGSGMNAGGLTMTPSIGILSYWQGVVEIGLRLGSLVSSVNVLRLGSPLRRPRCSDRREGVC